MITIIFTVWQHSVEYKPHIYNNFFQQQGDRKYIFMGADFLRILKTSHFHISGL